MLDNDCGIKGFSRLFMSPFQGLVDVVFIPRGVAPGFMDFAPLGLSAVWMFVSWGHRPFFGVRSVLLYPGALNVADRLSACGDDDHQ